MYDNCYERVEDPRGAENMKWRTEADGEGTRGVQPTEEQTVAELSLTNLLWSGAKAVAAPFLSGLGQRGATLEECEEIVIIGGEPREESKQMDFLGVKVNQNGGSRLLGKPHGPVAEKMADAGLAKSWPGMARTAEPRPDGGHGAKAMAAPGWTVTNSAPVLSQPLSLWGPPLISTRGSDFQLWPVGMHPLGPGTDIQTAPLQKVVPAVEEPCKKDGYLAQRAAARKRRELAAGKDPHPCGEIGAKTLTAPTRTERGAALIKGHDIPLWDPPIIATPGGGFQLCQRREEPKQGVADPATSTSQLRGTTKLERPLQRVAPVKRMACSSTVGTMVSTKPYSVPSGVLVVRVANTETVVGLCLQCGLPGGTVNTAARCPHCGTLYLWPMPTFIPIQPTDPPVDVTRRSAESPGALWINRASPGDKGLEPVKSAGSVAIEAAESTPAFGEKRLSPRPETPKSGKGDYSDEDLRELAVVKAELKRQTGRTTPRGVSGRTSPADRRPDRRSPAIPGPGGDGRETPTPLRTGKPSSPITYLVTADGEALEGPRQAQSARGGTASLSATTAEQSDVVIEEEIPHGGPTQDGDVSGSGEDVTSGGDGGTHEEKAATLRRSGEGPRSLTRPRNWRDDLRTEEGETSSLDQSTDSQERVVTPWGPVPCPYAQTPAIVNTPTPIPRSPGSPSSLEYVDNSQGGEGRRTGERQRSGATEGDSRGGGELRVATTAPQPVVKASGSFRWSVPRSERSSGVFSMDDDRDSGGSNRFRENRWWAPLFEGYSAWMDRTRFLIRREDVVDYWWAVGEFTPEQRDRELQERWLQIENREIEPMGPSILSGPVDPDEPLSWVLPGRGGKADLTRISRAERTIMARYKSSHGLEYPYVPEPLMDEIEDNRDRWLREAIEMHLVGRGSSVIGKKAEERIEHLIRIWAIGRNIYKHRVTYRPERGLPRHFSVIVLDMGGREVKKPDPYHYF
ncbi:uncharacterized protein LOC142491370 [Ascaphus truei]|uniref:uncharacterized protein LOC142491370 n=1 Tax=Ascaphus truei TaxID=8439 RepID=UPI003F598644